ncbi:unnamed protein product [Timema podura]|uniref:Uncharacterized protein n=1 Tax=Timema podura TaxID=61482 RepID=A0ABN7NGH2_TIMPD|nr:unnamed protein product [Timema podura]
MPTPSPNARSVPTRWRGAGTTYGARYKTAACRTASYYMFRMYSAEFESSEQVDSFVLDLCTMLMSVKNVGIISRAPSYCPQLFQHPVLLHDALTSHLQTAGCTLVMGTSFHDVNMTNASSDCSATITQVSSLPLANRAVFEGLASIMFK